MKKLNNTEIGVLAQRIQSEAKTVLSEDLIKKAQDKANSIWDKFQKSNDFKILLKYKVEPTLSMVFPEIKLSGYKVNTKYSYSISSTEVRTNGGKIYFTRDGKDISYDAIRDELILGQIEATDLESLISRVKASLKLT